MATHDIYNALQIDERTLLAGQPTEAQFREAKAEGYAAVINLAPGGLKTSLPDESTLLRSLGLDYRHIPVPWNEPQGEQLDAFFAAMGDLEEQRVLIHCQANYRVTAFYALYAIKVLNWTREHAQTLIDRIWTSRPGYTMDERWAAFIEEQAARVMGETQHRVPSQRTSDRSE